MEVWIDERRPEVLSTANVVLALVIHVACFLGFFFFARFHFKPKETVIPIDLTVVVNENLDGNEDEPPPLNENLDGNEDEPPPLDDPPPKPPEPPKVVTPPPPPPPKVDTKVDAVVKEPEKKKPEKPKETLEERLKRMRESVKDKPEPPKKEEPKKPEKTKEELLKERMEKMRNSAKTVKIRVPDKPSGNGKTAKQTMTEAQIRDLLNKGYTPGSKTQLATSTMQLCLSRIQMAINARWSQVNPRIGAEGYVLIAVRFNSAGQMVNCRLSESCGDKASDSAALTVVRCGARQGVSARVREAGSRDPLQGGGAMTCAVFLLAAVKLVGVTGGELTTRAYFDVNNAKVGDPLVLTIDFVGDADFTALHPPALSRHVPKEDWKVDDLSAKTETDTKRVGGFFSSREVAVARSLTYRVRPMREGVLWFPALEFEYEGPDGEVRTVAANEIPVHAKPGEQVVVKELAVDVEKMPEPPELAEDPGVALGDDELFAWRKACAEPTADAFRDFRFAAGRMNEATCAIREGQWRRALGIYSRLEWSVGQTPEIERGILAARALKFDNAAAELPVWRVVGRPLLRYAWKGRVGILLGLALGVALLFWLLGRAIRALACVAFALLLVPAASGQGIFEEMERMMEQSRREMQQHMQQMHSSMGMTINGERQKPVEIKASVRTEPAELQVGEPFSFVLALETPRSVSIGQVQITPSEMFGLTVVGRVENLTDGVSKNSSNVVKRLSIPVRYDVPFKGKLSFAVTGMVSGRQRAGNMSFSFSNSFSVDAAPIDVDIKPLPSAGQPDDFSGIISEGLGLSERLDMKKVGTNDVIRITYRLECRGYLPKGWRPEGVAFEIGRGSRSGVTAVEWMRYFVADGAAETPRLKVVYYDVKSKEYRKAETGGAHVEYEK